MKARPRCPFIARANHACRLLAGLLLPAFLAGLGCRTPPELPPADLTAPGWRVQHGQAVWRPQTGAPEIAGELMVASRGATETLVQFVKTPLPLVVAHAAPGGWVIQFMPQERKAGGRGAPSSRFAWFQLVPALADQPLPDHWRFARVEPEGWRLENLRTGERLEGYLNP